MGVGGVSMERISFVFQLVFVDFPLRLESKVTSRLKQTYSVWYNWSLGDDVVMVG